MSETFDPDALAEQLGRRFVSTGLIAVALVVGAVVTTAYTIFLKLPVIIGIGFFAFLAVPVCAAAAVSNVQNVAVAVRRRIELAEGMISVTIRNRRESHPLHRCCWFRGRTHDDADLANHPLRGRAILIVFPTGRFSRSVPVDFVRGSLYAPTTLCNRGHRSGGRPVGKPQRGEIQ